MSKFIIFSFTSYSRLGCWFQKPSPLSMSSLLLNSACSDTRLRVLDLKENGHIPFSMRSMKHYEVRSKKLWGRFFPPGKRETHARKISAEHHSFSFFFDWSSKNTRFGDSTANWHPWQKGQENDRNTIQSCHCVCAVSIGINARNCLFEAFR